MLHAKSKYCLVFKCIHESSPRKISSAASCQPQFLYQAGDLSLLLLSAWFHHGETLVLNINDIISSNQFFVNVNNYVYFRSRKGPHIWPLSKSQKCPQSTIVTYMLICDQSRRTWRRWCFLSLEQLTCSSHTRVANLVGLATENINRTYSENHTKNNYLPRKPFKRGDGK